MYRSEAISNVFCPILQADHSVGGCPSCDLTRKRRHRGGAKVSDGAIQTCQPSLPALPALLSALLYQPLSLRPAGLASSILSTRSPPPPPPEISSDPVAVAMAVMMAVATTCCWASEEARASGGAWGKEGEAASTASPLPMESLKCDRI